MKLFLSPHCDDETLFGAFSILREKPLVVVLLDSFVQEQRGAVITAQQRRAETLEAMKILSAGVEFLGFRDDAPDWQGICGALRKYSPELVFAPADEAGGHGHHNAIARIADNLFRRAVKHYMTYTAWGKSVSANIVPFEPGWPLLKLRALACYESQIGLPDTRPHFLRAQYEYLE